MFTSGLHSTALTDMNIHTHISHLSGWCHQTYSRDNLREKVELVQTSQVLAEHSGRYDGGAGPPWPWKYNSAAHLKVDKEEEGGPEPEAC